MDVLQEDNGDGSMMCMEHPFKNNTPAGGICAFCLQEKLGKLVSSAFPTAVFPSSSSSSPSFRSDNITTGGTNNITNANTTNIITTNMAMSSNSVLPTRLTNLNSNTTNGCHFQNHHQHNNNHHHQYSNRSRVLYLLGQRKKKKKDLVDVPNNNNNNIVFKRSKSTAVGRGGVHYLDSENDTPRKQSGFWSFLYLQKHSHSTSSGKDSLKDMSSNNTLCPVQRSRDLNTLNTSNNIVVEENESPCHATFDRKVSRSRSVGCGSRSFSGDFFERISTGFGDCTLRRVESTREGKSKVTSSTTCVRNNGSGGGHQDCIHERVRCGGLFSGFMITSSSSSSSSSSNWVGSNCSHVQNGHGQNGHGQNDGNVNVAGKVTSAGVGTRQQQQQQQNQHARSRSWGWALASPMRAFSKTSSSSSKKDALNKNRKPNLAAVPSLLSVGS